MGWRVGSVIRALDWGSKGRGFESRVKNVVLTRCLCAQPLCVYTCIWKTIINKPWTPTERRTKRLCIPVCCMDLCLCVCVSRTVCLTHGLQFLFQLTLLEKHEINKPWTPTERRTKRLCMCCMDLCLCVHVSSTVRLTHRVQFLFQLTHLGQSQAGPGIDAPRVETHVVRVELDRFAEVKINNQNQIRGDNS